MSRIVKTGYILVGSTSALIAWGLTNLAEKITEKTSKNIKVLETR